MPDNPIIQELARFLDAPIMTTTLPYEENEDIEYCTDPELIDEKFGNIVDLVIDGGIGGIEGCNSRLYQWRSRNRTSGKRLAG